MTSEKRNVNPVLFDQPAFKLGYIVLFFPSIGCIICIILSVWKDFDNATATHCRVANYLPSISSTIGGYTPQRYIWRICIALQSAPRIMFAIMYYNYYLSLTVRYNVALYRPLVHISFMLHIIENSCLIVLSYVSSTENYSVHEKSFILFLVSSEFYMLLQCSLYYWSRSDPLEINEKKALKSKIVIFAMSLLALASAAYLFYRHNKYCEPGVFSLFALCEYIVVASNIIFHGASFMQDFGSAIVSVQIPKQAVG